MAEQNKEVFIVDSNTFITPKNFYYSFEIAPTFWDRIREKIISKEIVILDKVFNEIVVKQDELSNWLQTIRGLEQIDYKQSEIIANYGKVISHIQTCGLYTPVALHTWAQEQVADPWIVATALTFNYVVISLEASINGLNTMNPSNKPKIEPVKYFV